MNLKLQSWYWCSLVFIILSFVGVDTVFSQQVIWLKNGKKFKANVTYRTHDTLVYILHYRSKVEDFVLMRDVDKIQNLNPDHKILWDTLPEKRKEELFLKYKNLKDVGDGILIGGVIADIAGLILVIPPALKDFNPTYPPPDWVSDQLTGGLIICGIGVVGLITGAVLESTGKSNMKKYSIKHPRFSFNINYTPKSKGISLTYRF